MICFPILCQLSAPDVLFPGAPACTWNCMAPLLSFFPSLWRPWRFLPWSPYLHLKLHGASLVHFSVNLAPLTFSSLEPLLAFETAWRHSRPFLRQFGAPDVFLPGAPACTWNCMVPLSSFSLSIWRPWRFHPWIPCLHLKLHGASLVFFSVNLVPLTFLPWSPCLHLKLHGTLSSFFSVNLAPLMFSSLEPLLALETAWHPFVLFSVNLAPWRFLPWIPYLHLKLHGAPLVLFSINLAPLTFSSLEPLLSLETAWRISRPFSPSIWRPDVFFPGAPACTWNCMAPLSSFSPSIWRPWRFLPWSPYFYLKLHGASLVLFLRQFGAPMFSSLEPLLALETSWRPSRPFFRQFGAPDVFFPGAPTFIWNCMAPLSSFSPSIWRPWRFLPWSPCLHLKPHGISSYWFDLLSFFSAPSFFPFFFLIPFFYSFFLFSPLSLSFSFLFSFFLAPLWWPRGARAPKAPPKIRPCWVLWLLKSPMMICGLCARGTGWGKLKSTDGGL